MQVISFRFWVMLNLVMLCALGNVNQSFSQEENEQPSAIDISFKCYSVSKAEILDLIQDGITKDEWHQLENEWFEENGLFENEEALSLQKGNNSINIPESKVESFVNNPANTMIVFFFKVMREEERVDESLQLTQRSYVITEKEEEEKTLAEKEGKWQLPAGSKSYRYFDFRSAVHFLKDIFVYELRVPQDEDSDLYNITMNVTES